MNLCKSMPLGVVMALVGLGCMGISIIVLLWAQCYG